YQGAPTCVTAFMSAGTKVAAFGAFLRVFGVAFLPLAHDWRPFMGVLAAVSIVVGSVLAIAQTDIKRLLAYSSIAQAGFLLVGLAGGAAGGVPGRDFFPGGLCREGPGRVRGRRAGVGGGRGAYGAVLVRGARPPPPAPRGRADGVPAFPRRHPADG